MTVGSIVGAPPLPPPPLEPVPTPASVGVSPPELPLLEPLLPPRWALELEEPPLLGAPPRSVLLLEPPPPELVLVPPELPELVLSLPPELPPPESSPWSVVAAVAQPATRPIPMSPINRSFMGFSCPPHTRRLRRTLAVQ